MQSHIHVYRCCSVLNERDLCQTWVHYIHHAIVINGLGITPIMSYDEMKPCYTHCVGVVLCKMEHVLLVVMSPLHGHIHQANVDGWGIKTSMF